MLCYEIIEHRKYKETEHKIKVVIAFRTESYLSLTLLINFFRLIK